MDDLIYRQAAKDVIHKRLGTMDLFESRFNTDIDQIPPIDPESLRPQWVSIYDKLPPEGERVLATDGAFVGEMYINKRGQWQRYNVNDSALMMALDILWWMPMPQPPETKGAGENA